MQITNNNLSIKKALESIKAQLSVELSQKVKITTLTNKLVNSIDTLLIDLFHKHHLQEGNQIALIALGSYGRRELQLYSDVDLLLLHSESLSTSSLHNAQLFIQDCWDIGLEISHQMTTVKACAELAAGELSVISSLLDMRALCGCMSYMDELLYQTHTSHMWPSIDFFFAKQQEQNRRHEKYDGTAYNLEPNIKHGPGGMRDIQILLAIGKRHFGIKNLAEGINCGFIAEKEYEELIQCQHFLMRVRFALHHLARKKEERLLFDYQIKLAELFGFKDAPQSLAIEQFMKTYFNVIKRTRELNEMLLQWFTETILHHKRHRLVHLDDAFQLSNNYIEVRHSKVFSQNPHALIQLFLWIAKRPEIIGVRAGTIRLIHQNLYLITTHYCSTELATETFMTIFKTRNNPYPALQKMSQFGVLGHYLECFAAVTGQMQYDLFHVYTVEQHTLFVIRNLGRFNEPEYASQFPLAFKIMQTLPKHEILYLAGLFHDIAKGRGGCHSELGALEAASFSKQHHLETYDQQLLIWLVQHHLLMSKTTQREDIYDPKTIQKFCSLLPNSEHLDYLYLLTIADICGTNPALWNTWKDSLLKELYYAAKDAMLYEKALLNEAALIATRRQDALDILHLKHTPISMIMDLWQTFKGSYFLHEPAESIARHTKAILECRQYPLVHIMPHPSLGGTEVFIYMPHRDERFTITTTILSNYHVTIHNAKVLSCSNQFDLDTYIILDDKNQLLLDEKHLTLIKNALIKHLTMGSPTPVITQRRLSRTQAHFNIKPQISYTHNQERQQTCLFLMTNDRPGLLAHISNLFLNEKIHLHQAKIETSGERVEDMFFISNQKGCILSQAELDNLRIKLINMINCHKS